VRLHAENKHRLSFDEVVDVAKQCSMPTAPDVISLNGEVRDALSTLHRLGQLLWWGDSEKLNNTVVLDPQWLIGAFTAIIRDPSLHPMQWVDMKLDRLVAAGAKRKTKINSAESDAGNADDTISVLSMANAVLLLRNRCVLSESLFDTVWPVSAGTVDTDLPCEVDNALQYTVAEQKVKITLSIRP
jgi:hypothetical protein